jgi:hypothetical protein
MHRRFFALTFLALLAPAVRAEDAPTTALPYTPSLGG